MNLEKKRVLIIGGSSGIGLATAQAMIAAGAHVFITGRWRQGLATALDRLGAGGGRIGGAVADVATDEGRATTLAAGIETLGGLDILINNAGGVRAGRLEDTTESEIRAMIEVDLVAPILLTHAALPHLRASGDGLIVNITSAIALVGMSFYATYATYAAVKAGLARFGESMRRELKGDGIHVLTVYPGATDTPMMTSSRAGPELGFSAELAAAVADAVPEGIRTGAFEVIRGGAARAEMIRMNRESPDAVDQRFLDLKPAFAEAVRDHPAL